MDRRHTEGWSRREFLELTLAGAAGLLGLKPESVAAEPPPETTRIRLWKTPAICTAPQYIAEELLKAEGFIDVQYVKTEGGVLAQNLARGEVDIGMNFIGPNLIRIEAGDPVVILAGGHVGCFELFGSEQVHNIRDLKGKTVALVDPQGAGDPQGGGYTFLASMMLYIGLDPRKDINRVITHSFEESARFLAEGKIDAILAFPPLAQELQAKQIGHVVVNSALDHPWSQYFCCLVIGHRDFVRQHPVATKRALRAILKAANLCALQPDHTAHLLVDKGFTQHYDYTLQLMRDIPYDKWREYNPEDTVRFYALRLHEVGMIKSTPQKIIAEGTDWRFLNELKQELKGV